MYHVFHRRGLHAHQNRYIYIYIRGTFYNVLSRTPKSACISETFHQDISAFYVQAQALVD